MSISLIEKFEQLKSRQRELMDKKIESETMAKAHKQSYESAIRKIQEGFGVKTLREAKDLLGKFSEDLETYLTRLEKQLDEFE